MASVRRKPEARFNVLLTEAREQAVGHWTRQLPRLLQPQGFTAYVARTGREALDLVASVAIHAALIDLSTPRGELTGGSGSAEAARFTGGPEPSGASGSEGSATRAGRDDGLWLLEVIRRLPQRPPVVVVNSILGGPRQAQRLLNEALRLGAFSVINRPVELEAMLGVIRRLVDRAYDGTWPNMFSQDPDPDRSDH